MRARPSPKGVDGAHDGQSAAGDPVRDQSGAFGQQTQVCRTCSTSISSGVDMPFWCAARTLGVTRSTMSRM
jgi:hypothetical protein